MRAMIGVQTNRPVRQPDQEPGVAFSSNADQVEKMVRILTELNMEAASVADARDILGLPA